MTRPASVMVPASSVQNLARKMDGSNGHSRQPLRYRDCLRARTANRKIAEPLPEYPGAIADPTHCIRFTFHHTRNSIGELR
jgi:hypothetical protein